MPQDMNRFNYYLNPIARLGRSNYSVGFPAAITLLAVLISEAIAYLIFKNPESVGLFAIFVFVGLIIYFSFRDGIKGGLVTAILTILYYFYIVFSRHHSGDRLVRDLETIGIFLALYVTLAVIIGWLRQKIDGLIEREGNERRRLQTIVQQLPVGVVVTDKEGKIEMANKQADIILGAKIPKGHKVGREPLVKANYKNKPISNSHSLILQVLTTGKAIVDREYVIDKENKRKIHLLASATPIFNREGKVIAAASILNDITQQKELEERKDDFVNMASHELKTPITSMKLYVESLSSRLGDKSGERTKKTLDSIKYQIIRLQNLVSDLLDVSRLQTGKLSFNKEEFRLDSLVAETAQELQGSAKQTILCSTSSHLRVSADKFRIYQVLTNIMTNAIKYSPAQSQIKIKVVKEDGRAIVSVQDSGIGITKEQQKKIFDRLYQVTDDTEKTFPGFGMGLYISKEIIKRHKGNIWVESEKGKGSIFYFSLPLFNK